MLPIPYFAALTDLLYAQNDEFLGIYDLKLGWFMYVNAAAVRLLDYPDAQTFLTDPDHSLRQPPWTPEQWHTLCERAWQEGRQEIEAQIRCYSGSVFRAHVEFTYFEVEKRALFLIRMTKRNRLQQAERALAHSVRRFEAVFTNATIGIVVSDERGEIVAANQLVEHLFCYQLLELLDRRIDQLVPGVSSQLPGSVTPPTTLPAVVGISALRGRRQDGSTFPVEVSLSYFHLDEELYTVACILDVTDKQSVEQALITQHKQVAQLNAELEQKVADRTHALLVTLEQLEQRSQKLALALAAEQELGELKSRFVSIASHEFRTPLTVVLTSAALIEDYPITEQQGDRQRHVQRIRAAVKHLNDILEEFLSVGRIEEGSIEAHPLAFDMADLLTETLADVQGLLKTGQTVARYVECSSPLPLDPSLMRKILVNLLSNAIKYSGEHSVVTVTATCTHHELTIQVLDTGVGISREDQAQLFKPFSRASNVSNVHGTGLGLYIVVKYLDLMKGNIALQSELNRGTTVTISIPFPLADANHSAD